MSKLVLLAAEWVLPVASSPIRDGVVAVEGDRIAWVGSRRELPSRYLQVLPRVFPRAVILPGWVNAHSHLNLTAALGMLQGSAERFADWIRSVIRLQESLPAEIISRSVLAGLDLLASTGTTTVAHVATLPDLDPFLTHPMRAVIFHEPIGFSAGRAPELLRQTEEWLDKANAAIAASRNSRITLGLAPHSPYSASPQLIRGIARLAEMRRLPLSVHLAETHAEAEFVATGAGQLRDLLVERGAWEPAWTPPGVSPVRYLYDLGVLERPGVAAHCNYLSDADIRLLAQGRLVPAWCPGSHRFFGHHDHPAARLMAARVPVALGTDSPASNIALNMLHEVRQAAQERPEVDPAAWLRAATLTAAEALGLGAVTGSLEAGKAADLQVLDGLPETTPDPLPPLLEERLRVRLVLVDGREVRIK